VFTSLRDGVYGDALCWSGYGGLSLEEMETGRSGLDINDHVNTSLANQWDGIQGQTFVGSNVSLSMENGALSADFMCLPPSPFEFGALLSATSSVEIDFSNDVNRIEYANNEIGEAHSANHSTGRSQQAPTDGPPIVKQANDRFCCDTPGCTRSYKRFPELKRHKAKHSGIRNHACTIIGCNRSGTNGFTRKDHLRQHLRQVHGFISRGRDFGVRVRVSRKAR